MEGNFPTMDAPTPEAHKQKEEQILRSAAIESATPEELDQAIEKVRKNIDDEPNPVLTDILRQLEETREQKSPDTIH